MVRQALDFAQDERTSRQAGGVVAHPASAAFTSPLARAGSMLLAWRAFTSAMTRPMSFIDEAPSSAMIAAIAALGFVLAHLLRQEPLDDRDFGLFGFGQLGAAALAVERLPIRGAA